MNRLALALCPGEGKSFPRASDIIRSFASNSLSFNALRSPTVEKILKRLSCVHFGQWLAGFMQQFIKQHSANEERPDLSCLRFESPPLGPYRGDFPGPPNCECHHGRPVPGRSIALGSAAGCGHDGCGPEKRPYFGGESVEQPDCGCGQHKRIGDLCD